MASIRRQDPKLRSIPIIHCTVTPVVDTDPHPVVGWMPQEREKKNAGLAVTHCVTMENSSYKAWKS